MKHSVNQNSAILCFRAFDMRDRFPEPVETFEEALVLLQSDRAYLPEMNCDIFCYLKSGKLLAIPHEFYIREKKVFSSIEDATRWVHERDKESGFSLSAGIANPELPINEQIKQAWDAAETVVVSVSENVQVCKQVNDWLNDAIHAFMHEELRPVVEDCFPQPHDDSSTSTLFETNDRVDIDEETIAWFKARFADQKNPKRWVITSSDCAWTGITGNAYFDVVNHLWVSRISDATCIKDKAIAEAIVASFGEEFYADVIEHFVSQKELAKAAIKLESDPAVIYYHSKTDTYLYEERNCFSDYATHALIALSNPDQFTLLKRSPGEPQLFVSIPDEAMDKLALAWCKHRHISSDTGVSED